MGSGRREDAVGALERLESASRSQSMCPSQRGPKSRRFPFGSRHPYAHAETCSASHIARSMIRPSPCPCTDPRYVPSPGQCRAEVRSMGNISPRPEASRPRSCSNRSRHREGPRNPDISSRRNKTPARTRTRSAGDSPAHRPNVGIRLCRTFRCRAKRGIPPLEWRTRRGYRATRWERGGRASSKGRSVQSGPLRW